MVNITTSHRSMDVLNEASVREEIERLKAEINKVAILLLQENPRAQNLMGQQAALIGLLEEPSNGSVSKGTEENEVLEELSQ